MSTQQKFWILGIISLSIVSVCKYAYAELPTVKLETTHQGEIIFVGSEAIAITANATGPGLTFSWNKEGPGRIEGGTETVHYFPPEDREYLSALVTISVTLNFCAKIKGMHSCRQGTCPTILCKNRGVELTRKKAHFITVTPEYEGYMAIQTPKGAWLKKSPSADLRRLIGQKWFNLSYTPRFLRKNRGVSKVPPPQFCAKIK